MLQYPSFCCHYNTPSTIVVFIWQNISGNNLQSSGAKLLSGGVGNVIHLDASGSFLVYFCYVILVNRLYNNIFITHITNSYVTQNLQIIKIKNIKTNDRKYRIWSTEELCKKVLFIMSTVKTWNFHLTKLLYRLILFS